MPPAKEKPIPPNPFSAEFNNEHTQEPEEKQELKNSDFDSSPLGAAFEKLSSLPSLSTENGSSVLSRRNRHKPEELTDKATLTNEAKQELYNLAEGQKEQTTLDPITEQDVGVYLEKLVNQAEENPSVIIDDLIQWAEEDDDPTKFARSSQIETKLTSILRNSEKGPNLSIFVLLGKLAKTKNYLFMEDDLARQLGRDNFDDQAQTSIIDQIGTILRINTPETNKLAHEVLFLMQDWLVLLQNTPIGEINEDKLLRIIRTLERELEKTPNYILREQVKDLIKTMKNFHEAEAAGVPGGANDNYIFETQHLADSYTLRLQGMNMGDIGINALIPISPQHVGYYSHGQLREIYSRSQQQPIPTNEFIEQNDPAFDSFYYFFNNETSRIKLSLMRRKEINPSMGLELLNNIHTLQKNLQEANEFFFIDLDRIEDFENLHPTVKRSLYGHNLEYLKNQYGEDTPEPITPEEYKSLLSPAQELDSSQNHGYRQLMSSGMRKKIEDGFGIDLAEHSFWVQRNFLSYIERVETIEIERLQAFVKEYGENGLKAFLALEQDPDAAEKILHITDTADQETAKKLFEKFTEITDQTDNIREYLNQHFDDKTPQVEQVISNLLKRAGKIIESNATKINEDAESIEEELDALNTDILVFSSAFQALQQEGIAISLSEIANTEFESVSMLDLPEEEREQTQSRLRTIMEANYRRHYPEKIVQIGLKGLETAFENPNTRIHILRHEGEIMGFFRIDEKTNNTLYLGSVNLIPDAAGSKLGEAMMREIIEAEAETKTIEADVTLELMPYYMDNFGFVGVSVQPDYHGTGETLFGIEIDREATPAFQLQSAQSLSFDYLKLKAGDIQETHEFETELKPWLDKTGSDKFYITGWDIDKENNQLVVTLQKALRPE